MDFNITTQIPLFEQHNYVRVEDCYAFAKNINQWSLVYQLCLAGFFVIYLLTLNKYGALDKEKKWIKNMFKGDD